MFSENEKELLYVVLLTLFCTKQVLRYMRLFCHLFNMKERDRMCLITQKVLKVYFLLHNVLKTLAISNKIHVIGTINLL